VCESNGKIGGLPIFDKSFFSCWLIFFINSAKFATAYKEKDAAGQKRRPAASEEKLPAQFQCLVTKP
jgi:hypothetical protein